MQFLQDVFIGKKDVVLNNQVPQFVAPTQPELSVKHVFNQLTGDDELMRYFDTDRVAKGKYPERHFFWGILLTVRKDLATSMINEVLDSRLASGQMEDNAQPLPMNQIWVEKLLEFPTLPG